jgi:2-dehydro-3-deoxygluconokinase
MYDVIALGEAMVRLTPPNFQRLEQAVSLDVNIGGSELNTAVGLSRLGMRTAWVSKLTSNALGRMVVGKAREHGVDTSHVVWTDEARVGVYFVEPGASPRASQVLYDRRGAAITTLRPEEVEWNSLLAQTKVFHISGITPALSADALATTEAAIEAAHANKCLVTMDMNYRVKLWTKDAARECLSRLLPKVNVLLTTSDDLEIVFGLTGDRVEVARRIKEMFSLDVVAITIREAPTVLRGTWTSIALADKLYEGKVTQLELIDRVGSGDAYTAGFIYGYLTGDVAKAVAYGDAMSVLKHSMPGDFIFVTEKEVTQQTKSSGTKIVR